ncbi:hypothetical protein K2173_017270 [Erythroxylum novogranatense]|uniref:Cytochrome c oxidase assembly factor 3 mitochondrial coiled-coil domain-containing protein n=1 Tax=Erythroxylum novogranatense TaxID=1862640 RepID=A0AAV8U9Q4_9ROSI|nr:hypothetical protein K2173_017270 [Erythroxylum novogranatense]
MLLKVTVYWSFSSLSQVISPTRSENSAVIPSCLFADQSHHFAVAISDSGCKMAGVLGYGSLAPKTKNLVVAGGLSAFVFGVYFYTMRAVGGTDELQVAIDKFESQKSRQEAETQLPKA